MTVNKRAAACTIVEYEEALEQQRIEEITITPDTITFKANGKNITVCDSGILSHLVDHAFCQRINAFRELLELS